jgi:putative intracellular protease/amidase
MNPQNKKALFILPHHNFRDKEYLWIKEQLDIAGVTSEIASSHLSEIQGEFGTLLNPDSLISYVSSGDYDAFIFIGEEAAKEYYADPEVVKLVTNAIATHKLVAAIGFAVPILTYSGGLTDRKITGPDSIQQLVEDAGAYYIGSLVEQDGDIITAHNPYATRELAESIIKALEWSDEGERHGRTYLR